MLVSSFVDAGRAFGGVAPQDYTDDCYFLRSCKDGSDCNYQCERKSFCYYQWLFQAQSIKN
ncbi:hypothetical protein MKX03_032970 [Papaver bracteatum]|nr:hypothetical protein MKX03_032970 [Papaver bracteatum]